MAKPKSERESTAVSKALKFTTSPSLALTYTTNSA